MGTLFVIFIIVAGAVALWALGIYNRLVRLKNQVNNAWSQVDVQLQRRYDLIPNLVETVKGYMQHERGTLEAVVMARNQAAQAIKALKEAGGPAEGSLRDVQVAESGLTAMLGKLFALSENYPDLKANQSMYQLQEELRSTENRIAFSRQAYNDQVLTYNTTQQEFPAKLLATTFGHHPADLYEITTEKAKEPVKVAF